MIHLLHPKRGFRLLTYFGMLVFAAVSILLVVGEKGTTVLHAVIYAIAAVLLTFSAIYLVQDIRAAVQAARRQVNAHDFTRHMAEDFRYRSIVFNVPSLLGNLLFALLNTVTAVSTHSHWLTTMAIYYLVLAAMRLICLLAVPKLHHEADPTKKFTQETKVYLAISGLFLVLSLVLIIVSMLLNASMGESRYPGVAIYAAALYAFIRIVLATRGLFSANKWQSPLLMILRKIGYIDACFSLLTLQIAMFAAFGPGAEEAEFIHLFNRVTSLAVCVLTIVSGVQGLVHSTRQLKKLRLSAEADQPLEDA